VGGLWDRSEHRYVGEATKARVITVFEGQRETVEYWFDWLGTYLADDPEEWREFARRHGKRPFSLWAVGGRRRGKTFIGVPLLAAFAIAVPGSTPWCVAPTEDDFIEGEELHRYWRRALPPSWYKWDERELQVQLINGSRVLLKSAHDGAKLKAGGIDYCFFNEAQKVAQLGFDNVMGGIADTGSICHVAANPPRDSKGFWVQDLVAAIEQGTLQAKLLDYRHENPHVVEEALDALKGQMSLRDYAIEREGRFMARPNVVMHEFEEGKDGHVRPTPAIGEITGAVLRRLLGTANVNGKPRDFLAVVGMDFQLKPFMVASVKKLFLDPLDPDDFISWTVAEYYVEQGDENDLVDALERDSWHGHECAVVADGTGDYQQADRKKGRITGQGSWDMLRDRGWSYLWAPAPWIKGNNPRVEERLLVANARLRSADGRMHAFVDPKCVKTIEDLKKWENDARGRPSRYSKHAHMGDAWSYPEFRLHPRRFISKVPGEIKIVNIHRRDDRAY
jgi:hypothetical protein